MPLRPFKFVLQAHLLQEEKDRVVGEAATEPIVLYGESVQDLAAKFDEIIANGIKDQGV